MDAPVTFEAKVRKVGRSYGIIIPRKTLNEIGAKEGDRVIIGRIEKPAKEMRGILRGGGLAFEREHRDHDFDDVSG